MPTRKTSSPEAANNVSPVAPYLERDPSPTAALFDDRPMDPELAKYLNRDLWEQRGNNASNDHNQSNDIPANPTAPTPSATPQPNTFSTALTMNVNKLINFFSLSIHTQRILREKNNHFQK